jgi:prefoldin subunit 5
MNDLEKTIDKSTQAIEKLEDEVRAIGREKDDLRRDKFELLQQIATLTKKKNGDGGSEK